MQPAPFRLCDLAAFLGAFTARFSTFLAMIGLVFFAFFGAGIADVGTGFAQARAIVGAGGAQDYTGIADDHAIAAELGAVCHAGVQAPGAGCHAIKAGLRTDFEIVIHSVVFL